MFRLFCSSVSLVTNEGVVVRSRSADPIFAAIISCSCSVALFIGSSPRILNSNPLIELFNIWLSLGGVSVVTSSEYLFTAEEQFVTSGEGIDKGQPPCVVFSEDALSCCRGRVRIHLQGTRTIIDNLESGREVVAILTKYEGALDCYTTTLESEGVAGLYKGFGALVMQCAVHFALIKVTKILLTQASTLFRSASPPPPIHELKRTHTAENVKLVNRL
ncbi:hypothetical protein J6590_044706 [Homalodisca vitripennis]|nr:hypothetical protein J6590_044706 [Homalodisca vitripennis]